MRYSVNQMHTCLCREVPADHEAQSQAEARRSDDCCERDVSTDGSVTIRACNAHQINFFAVASLGFDPLVKTPNLEYGKAEQEHLQLILRWRGGAVWPTSEFTRARSFWCCN